MSKCSVPNCHNTKKTEGVGMHIFPAKNDQMFAVWVRRANNPQLDDLTPLHCNTSRYICDAHFADICKVNHLAKNARTNLKIHALPTLNMPGFVGDPYLEANCLMDKKRFQLGISIRKSEVKAGAYRLLEEDDPILVRSLRSISSKCTSIYKIPRISCQRFASVYDNPNIMSEIPSLQQVIKKLNDFAPLTLAESWDNVGLLIEPATPKPIQRILLTNDLTEEVVQEAIELAANLIITYHPSIFSPLKSVTMRTWKERITAICLENRIAVFSPHTSWDCVQGGVNDWLANAFEIETSMPIIKNIDPSTGAGRLCKLKNSISIQKAVDLVKAQINIPHVRLALAAGKTMDSTISSVAVCAGSGTSVFKNVTEADLLLTGEMQHHDILNAAQNGQHVILCNHSDSERGFLKEFKSILEKTFNEEISVTVSATDRDPLITV
ncbi:NIF3-like protein 1 [Ctenocephalides felis]|uniref:NIF3-like protein 1 n=1 Tax=Ctenocephalides felis TaxID=7515 RepID=UPI000E6E2D6A|nr:NIF3-like protein 1 [Ctenocephalides felis]